MKKTFYFFDLGSISYTLVECDWKVFLVWIQLLHGFYTKMISIASQDNCLQASVFSRETNSDLYIEMIWSFSLEFKYTCAKEK